MYPTTGLNWFVWLKSHQTADLMSTGVKDAGTYKVLRVGIDTVQDPSPKAHQLQTQVIMNASITVYFVPQLSGLVSDLNLLSLHRKMVMQLQLLRQPAYHI